MKKVWYNNEGFIRSDYIAIHNENNEDVVYISDFLNDCIRRYDEEGSLINKISITKPSGIAVDQNGNLYVASYATNDNSIYQYDKNGQFISKWGNSKNSYDNGQLNTPKGIAIYENFQSKSIFVVDSENNRIQRFTIDGKFIERWGTGNDKGELNNPRGINLDDSGNVYIADSLNKRIQVFNQNGIFQNKWDIYNNYESSRILINAE
ncbi:NHL repeat containing protein, partial [Candidatus Magnetomorum sp. HK-1]